MDFDFLDKLIDETDDKPTDSGEVILNLPKVKKNAFQEKTDLSNSINVLDNLTLNDVDALTDTADYSRQLSESQKRSTEMKIARKAIQKKLDVFQNTPEKKSFGFDYEQVSHKTVSEKAKNFQANSDFEKKIDYLLKTNGLSLEDFEDSNQFMDSLKSNDFSENSVFMKNKIREHFMAQKQKNWAKIKSRNFRKLHKKLVNAQKNQFLESNAVDVAFQQAQLEEKLLNKTDDFDMLNSLKNSEAARARKLGLDLLQEDETSEENVIDLTKKSKSFDITNIDEEPEDSEDFEVPKELGLTKETGEIAQNIEQIDADQSLEAINFVYEKTREMEESTPKLNDTEFGKDGWGSWAGNGSKVKKQPKWVAKSKEMQMKMREEVQRKRLDFGKKHLVVAAPELSENYKAHRLPSYISAEDYNNNLNKTISRDHNSAMAYENNFKDNLKVRRGYSIEAMSKVQAEKSQAELNKRKMGMVKTVSKNRKNKF